IALGDFNLDRRGDPNWEAFISRGLSAPIQLDDLPRTIFRSKAKRTSFYDQIAWFTKGNREALTLPFLGAGNAPWTEYLLRDLGAVAKSWRISDHYPLWAEFALGGP